VKASGAWVETQKEKRNDGEYGLLFFAACILLVVAWLSLWLVSNPSSLAALRYVGWLIWALSIALIVLAILTLRSQGKAEEGKDWVHSTALVTRGIYAVVRHPLYLGWSLMYVAVALFGQNWPAILALIPGITAVYLVSRKEERLLLDKFGDAYVQYAQAVPAMNFLVGVFRLLQRRTR
jgi:protein-S-isoprenylcysteine O-methyltransferase Ste14